MSMPVPYQKMFVEVIIETFELEKGETLKAESFLQEQGKRESVPSLLCAPESPSSVAEQTRPGAVNTNERRVKIVITSSGVTLWKVEKTQLENTSGDKAVNTHDVSS